MSAGVAPEKAAKVAGVDVERILAWEAGEERPSFSKLRLLGALYHRPSAIFFLPEPPADFQPMHDYRRLPDGEEHASPALRYQIRLAHWRRGEALALHDLIGEAPPLFGVDVSTAMDIETAAATIRAALNVPLEEQVEWRRPGAALRAWIAAVERTGVLVFQAERVDVAEMRGFSISERPLPAIVLNGEDSPNGRVFSLMHELVHVALRAGGVCNLAETNAAGRDNKRMERFCNQVASAILLPREDLLRQPLVRTSSPDGEWSDLGLAQLARHYSVSREALLIRLVRLGKASEQFYRTKRPQFLAVYEKYRDRAKKKLHGPPRPRMAVRAVGRRFTGLALEAYGQRQITGSTLSDYLGVKLRHLPAVFRELW